MEEKIQIQKYRNKEETIKESTILHYLKQSPLLRMGIFVDFNDGNPTILIFEQIEEYLASLQLIEKQRLFTFINTMKVNKPIKELVTF